MDITKTNCCQGDYIRKGYLHYICETCRADRTLQLMLLPQEDGIKVMERVRKRNKEVSYAS